MTYALITLGILWLGLLAGFLWFARKLSIYKENQERRFKSISKSIASAQLDISRVAHFAGMEPDDNAMDQITGILSDPARLDAELERSAQITEMRRANRRHQEKQ